MRCNNRDIELYMKGKKDGKEELQQENKQLKEEMKVLFEENDNKEKVIIKYQDNWNKLKEELNDLRARIFIKYNSNEWNNCLSFNDDILPIINKMQELEKEKNNEDN